jgi:acyl-CoA thioester hydrolase
VDGFAYTLELAVRDYECDMQGIVNNAVYQNYLEHARHQYLKGIGVDVVDFARRGIRLVVVRAELDYRHPLTSGDRFAVRLNLVRVSRIRYAFLQEIVRLPDGRPILEARILGAALNDRGRPTMPAELESLLA